MSVDIGKYYREQPTLRRMPAHWHLEDSDDTPKDFLSANAWLTIIASVTGACLLVQAVLAVAR